MPELRSPAWWIGGKFYSAERIVRAFPPPDAYDTYVEPFLGGAHVLFAKPPYAHRETTGDANADLVYFWRAVRECPDQLAERLDSLPYSRALYYDLHRRLREPGAITDPLERAAAWFYVLRAGMGGTAATRARCPGWAYVTRKQGQNPARLMHRMAEIIVEGAPRLAHVDLYAWDFETLLEPHLGNPRALIYCDPPYIDAESHYEGGSGAFTRADHRRLSALLNRARAMVALSYYEHPLVDELYPRGTWRRMAWADYKRLGSVGAARQVSHELLLMNYPEAHGGLYGDARANSSI